MGKASGAQIEVINTYAAKWTIAGWFIGLAYYNWFASYPEHLPLWMHVVFANVGMFAACIVIGGGVAVLVAFIRQAITGDAEGSPHGFGWAAFISPVLAFFAAKYALLLGAALVLSVMPAAAIDYPMEYQDNQYQFAFQFPQGWKLEKGLLANEFGEVRAIVKNPTRPIFAEAIVGQVGKTISKSQYEANSNRGAIVDGMIELTVEDVYKKVSRDIGAERVVVVERKELPFDAGIAFYISTVQMKGDMPMAVFGMHIIPFDKPYILAFLIVSPLDKTATADNEVTTQVFNSFHVIGEKPPQ